MVYEPGSRSCTETWTLCARSVVQAWIFRGSCENTQGVMISVSGLLLTSPVRLMVVPVVTRQTRHTQTNTNFFVLREFMVRAWKNALFLSLPVRPRIVSRYLIMRTVYTLIGTGGFGAVPCPEPSQIKSFVRSCGHSYDTTCDLLRRQRLLGWHGSGNLYVTMG